MSFEKYAKSAPTEELEKGRRKDLKDYATSKGWKLEELKNLKLEINNAGKTDEEENPRRTIKVVGKINGVNVEVSEVQELIVESREIIHRDNDGYPIETGEYEEVPTWITDYDSYTATVDGEKLNGSDTQTLATEMFEAIGYRDNVNERSADETHQAVLDHVASETYKNSPARAKFEKIIKEDR